LTVMLPVTSRGCTDDDAAAFRYGIDGISNEVGENLPDLSVVGKDEGSGAELADHFDAVMTEAWFEQGEDGADELMDIGIVRPRRGAIKAEGLDRDLGDAVELFLGETEIASSVDGKIGLGNQVETIDDCFERVVNFMSNRGGQAAGDREFLGAAEDLLALLLKRRSAMNAASWRSSLGASGLRKATPIRTSTGMSSRVLQTASKGSVERVWFSSAVWTSARDGQIEVSAMEPDTRASSG
jgi:hypothetical protein